MKRRIHLLSVLLVMTLALILLTGCQQKKAGWTLDEALGMLGTEQAAQLGGRILLSDDFSAYEAEFSEEYTADSGKIVILWREGGEVSYSRSSQPFPADYRGEQKTEPKVYLCADLMERIPEARRAGSAAEAATIIMAESYYFLDSSVISGADVSEPSEPGLGAQSVQWTDMNTTEYRPLFNARTAVMLYNTKTKGGTYLHFAEYPYAEMRDNPEADDLWCEMTFLKEMADSGSLSGAEERYERAMECLETLYYYGMLGESAVNAYYDLIDQGDFDQLKESCMKAFWTNAATLKKLDPGFEAEYDAAVGAENYEALEAIVNARSYSYISMANEEIIIRKAYMGTPDYDELAVMLNESLDFLDKVGWNMTDARRIALYGY